MILEIVSGPARGRNIWVRIGQSLRVGRTEQADVAIQGDSAMSGVHFSLECGRDGCRLQDLGSRNGTFLNGNKVADATIQQGDEIRAGATVFSVSIETGDTLAVSSGSDQLVAPKLSASAELAPASSTDELPLSAAVQRAAARSKRPYTAGLEDAEADVVYETLLAATWARQPWVVDYLRSYADKPDPSSISILYLLAILAKPEDLGCIRSLAKADHLGPLRMRILGAFGHPDAVEMLLPLIESEDPRVACAAGGAFRKITGEDISSDHRATLPPEDGSEPDEFEKEFLDEVTLPSSEAAHAHWNRLKDEMRDGIRWCGGLNLSADVGSDVFARLDLESRWEASLRGRFEGTYYIPPAELILLPQRPGAVRTTIADSNRPVG